MSRSLNDLEEVTREKAHRLIGIAAILGMEVYIVHTYRSYEEQNELYGQGRTKPGRVVTNARGGHSWHNFGRAIDFAFEDTLGKPAWEDLSNDGINDWLLLGQIGEKLGLEWGGRWTLRDLGHFHYTGGRTLEQLRLGHDEVSDEVSSSDTRGIDSS